MQNDDGGEAAAPPGPAKRMRRPSVRLHQPYYENPGHRKLQREWKAIKKDFRAAAKKPRTVRTARSKDGKNGGAADCDKGGEMEGFNFDDDVAIGNWKNFNAANGDGDFRRKRVRSSNSKNWVSRKSRKDNKDLEIENLSSSRGAESGENEEKEEEEEEEEEEKKNLGGDGNNSDLAIKNVDTSSPNCSFGNGDGNDKLSDDNGESQGMKQRGLSNGWLSSEMGGTVRRSREGDRDRRGVRVWLNKLGLGKYAPLFEVHGVDDEVLPCLTFEDLKDMGINEVGPRRKMYSSIQKLNKGFL